MLCIYDEKENMFVTTRTLAGVPDHIRRCLPYRQTRSYVLPDLLIVRGYAGDGVAEWDATPLDGSPGLDLYDEVRLANERGGTEVVRVWRIPGPGRWQLATSRHGCLSHSYRIFEFEDAEGGTRRVSFSELPDQVAAVVYDRD